LTEGESARAPEPTTADWRKLLRVVIISFLRSLFYS
jgi:hypothetical protein